MLFADVASCYWLFRGYGLCRIGCRLNFANLCFLFKPPPLPFFLFEASARLKLVSVPLTFAVYISFLVTLRKVSRRALCKALRWDKVDTIRRVCIVQYSTYSRFIWLNGSITGLKQKRTIMLAFLGWPLSLWPRKQSSRGQIYWARAQSRVNFGLGQDFFFLGVKAESMLVCQPCDCTSGNLIACEQAFGRAGTPLESLFTG